MISYTEGEMRRVLDVLKLTIRKKKFSSSKFPLFVFICGEQILDENNQIIAPEELRRLKNKRQYIVDATNKIESRAVVGIIAERLIETFSEHDSLTFEGILADVSDEIIIIVESAGTFCELGAFSFSKNLINKLYIINDKVHEADESFINRGPIRKISSSRTGKCKYIEYDTDSWNGDKDLGEHFSQWEKRRITYTPPKEVKYQKGIRYEIDIKNFVYELLNVLGIFQPISQNEFLEIYKYLRGEFSIKDSQDKIKQVNIVFDMLVKLGLIEKVDRYYWSTIKNKTSCNNYMFELSIGETEAQRARVASEYLKEEKWRVRGPRS